MTSSYKSLKSSSSDLFSDLFKDTLPEILQLKHYDVRHVMIFITHADRHWAVILISQISQVKHHLVVLSILRMTPA